MSQSAEENKRPIQHGWIVREKQAKHALINFNAGF